MLASGRFHCVALALLTLACASVGASPDAPAEASSGEDHGLSYGFEADYVSQYVWRGLAWSEGPVVQPSAWVTVRGLTFTAWADFGSQSSSELDEFDLTVSTERQIGRWTLEPALQIYTYPNLDDSPSTAEVSVKASYPVGAFTAFTTQSVDISEYSGAWFGDAGLQWEREVDPKTSLECTLSVGRGSSKFNEAYVGLARSVWNVVAFDASVTFRLGGSAYLRPHFSLSNIMDGQLRQQVDDPSLTVAGIALGWEF